MKISIDISSSVDPKDWNKQLSQEKESSTYQINQFGKVYQESYDSKPVYIWALDEKGRILGQLLSIFHKKYLLRNSNFINQKIFSNFNSCFWSYGPIIHEKEYKNDISKEIFLQLEKYTKNNNTMMINGSNSPMCNYNENYFYKNSFTSIPWKTYLVSLEKDNEIMLEKLNKKTRYDIRKSQENNLVFQIKDDFDTLSQYMKFSINVPARKNENRKIDDKFTDSFYRNLVKEGFAKIATVTSDNHLIGAILLFTFNKLAIQLGVENSSRVDLLGGPFLTWNTICWLSNKKFEFFDLGGANPNPKNKKEMQIDFYKSKWGGIELPFTKYSKILDFKRYFLFSSLRKTSEIFNKIRNMK